VSVNYPRPINQFNRLIYVSGSEATGSYSLGSRWNNVHNGSNYDGRNCTAAIGAVAIDAHTGGKITSNPAVIRNHQYDWSGGIGLDDVNVAWKNLWPGNALDLSGRDWADVLAALKENRFVAIQGDYDQIPYAYQCQKGGTFDHAFGLGGWRASDGMVLLYDPLCKHAVWVPQYVIRGSAEKLALAQRGTKSRLFAGVTHVMPPPYDAGVTYRYGGVPKQRGRWLARRDNVPVRSGPGTKYAAVAELDHRESFACRQSVGRWLGTADGRKWIYSVVAWYSGPITGTEDIS
jgi:hypothetical protein